MTSATEPLTNAPTRPGALADAQARVAIATDLDHTLFVEAGAGTGKTTALVERVVELVRSGTPLREVAAITFTEAAATELRHRLRRRLAAAERDGVVPAGTVDELDDAAISTLHAFAERLLLQFPVEAGLPPAFEVLDEVESAMALEVRFGAFLDDLFSRRDLEALLLQALTSNFRIDRLIELAAIFHDHRDRLPAGDGAATDAAQIDIVPVIDAIDRLLAHVPDCWNATDKLLVQLVGDDLTWQQVRARLVAAEAAGPEVLLHVLANEPTPTKAHVGTAKGWRDVDVVRADFKAALAAWASALDAVRSHVAVTLADQVREFTHAFARERIAAGTLVFHDLLVLARDLLRDHPDVRARLRQRWARLLIDEFQDTDPLQVEMAVLLGAADRGGEAASSWEDVELDPGRLFFVGDAKQSIYRFRRADIALYDRVRDELDTMPVAVTTNFRSVPGVLAWVNEVFAELLVDPEGTGGQATHQRLDAHRMGHGATAAVRMLGTEREAPIAEVRTIEAGEVAATILAARNERWPVGDEERAAALRDIAILVPTRAVLPYLEDALTRADLPYRVESASLVWSTQVVRDLLSVLRAVDQPSDSLAIVAALRTAALACSDRDLATWHAAGGRWALEAPLPDGVGPHHPVAVALGRLVQLAGTAWWGTVAALVDRAAHDLPFFELAAASGRARDQWRQLRFVIEQARAFDERAEPTLRRFLAWADLQASDDARVREPALPEDDHDAVRISTIHGAKGLEYPITIVCGLNVAPRGLDFTSVMWVGDQPTARLGKDFCTPGFREAAELEKAQAAHERRRLLYVAMTRAQDHLVVSLHRSSKPSRPSDATDLENAWTACDPSEALASRYEPPSAQPASDAAATAPATTPGQAAAIGATWDDEQRQWAAARFAAIERLRRAPVISATAVAATAVEEAEPAADKPEPGPDQPDHQVGRAGTAIGRAVHAVLQTADLAGADASAVAGLAAARAADEGVGHLAAQVERLAQAALRSELVRTAAGHRHWRELYVAAPIEGVVVEGFIDLLYDDGTGLTIVDHKTDAIGVDGLDAAARRYRRQLASYALVLEATTGRPVVGAALLFVGGGEARPVWIDDLAAAKAEVAAWLRSSV